jgi:hypothetical protein
MMTRSTRASMSLVLGLFTLAIAAPAYCACRGKRLLEIPLASAAVDHETVSTNGYPVVVSPGDLCAWSVQVYSPEDGARSDNLLLPPSDQEWSGVASVSSWACAGPPPHILPNTRIIAVRTTNHHICIRLTNAESEGGRFRRGELQVLWVD